MKISAGKGAVIILLLIFFFTAFPCAAIEPEPESLARDLTQKGWRYFNIGDVDTALKRFRQAIILDPDFAPGYYGVGYIYGLQNRFSLAIQYYRKSIELADSPDTHTYGNLGLLLLRFGRNPEGVLMLQRALEIDPENGAAHVALANYYCAEKQGALARLHLDKAQAEGIEPGPQLVEQLKTACP